jgi:arylsulfatase A-like enzyme
VAAQHNKPARHFRVTRLALAALLLLALAAPAAAQKAQPNLLVVMTDDQRASGTMAVMPQTRRKIGRQGTTYTNAHATTPKCCPSRASFFTGRYAHNHGVISNSRGANLDQSRTIQRLLQRRGYMTAIFGKYLNAWPVEVSPPFFDEWAISNGGFEDTFWNINGRVRTKHRYATDLVADWAVRFIRQAERRDDSQPWLAWVTPYAPHLPSTPAQRHRDVGLPSFPLTPAMQETDLSDKPPFLEAARNEEDRLEVARDDGRRSLIAVDEMVGRLMKELRERGEAGNTLVVFTSDNGFMLGEHGGVVGKDLPYPASSGIPLMVRWPGHFRRGRTNGKIVANIDVAATLLDAAGLRHRTDGRSLLERGRRSALLVESRGSYSEDRAPRLPAFRSILTRNYRYAEYYRHGTFDLIFREYYDHGIDPWELENRAPELTEERRQDLSDRVKEYGTCKGRSCP